ncbi:NADH:ubiquinone oxidoreductase, subunit G, iron- sulphur binding protein [Thermocrinis albus DSM 14484]|uniref:NADH:ubiquinone oxidoreductase, subunit G, iron-sulphur binding protein n=1 Tax=Thermocrinis albus (strain DSM 14484 / JCM 11386 / HI 11/12) TaxID=638303 RepID=D3SNC8_THEAH|nr:2Fe-2S iron-sulfur cluster-binding protein [Thermocrinis albus]ADC88665.1 NADH:ubiquinone oxidoreductase, subunit G, iron- sulphur binding protein [Thermocrinis albus DSM 14484]
MSTVKIKVNGQEYEVEKGRPLLQTLLDLGISVPYFCYHPKLRIIGACRMCVVYNEKTGRLMTSCNVPVEEGMEISTQHPSVVENQRYLLQAFMSRHPLDCPICDKAGECDLQNLGALFGPQRQIIPISALEKERHQIDWESDFLEYYSNRCVVCYRCTRVCDEVVGARALYVEERGFHTNIVPAVRPMDTSSCEMCGLCVYVCPVGAIISKPFKYWTRSWLLKKDRTLCNVCPVGCEIQVEYGVGDWRSHRKVYRTKPTDDLDICAKSFFGYDVLNNNRLRQPEIYGKKETPGSVVHLLGSMLKTAGRETAIVLSAYLSNELLVMFKQLVERSGAFVTSTLTANFYPFLRGYGEYQPPQWEEVKRCQRFLLIGDDITSTVPVLSYYIKGEVYRIGPYSRDAKLRPKEITWEEAKTLDKEGIIVVNISRILDQEAVQLGRRVREIAQATGWKVLVISRESNFLGFYRVFGDNILSPVEAVLKGCEEGKIKNLWVVGEDLLDLYPASRFEALKAKLEHLVVFSPFEDGLSQYAHIRVPIGLYGELEGTFTTLMGERSGRSFLPDVFDVTEFLTGLLEELPSQKVLQPPLAEGVTSSTPSEIHLYRSNWITRRSENLGRLYEKNVALQMVERDLKGAGS